MPLLFTFRDGKLAIKNAAGQHRVLRYDGFANIANQLIRRKDQVEKYFDEKITDEKIVPLLCRTAYSSIARACVLPLQDLLSLDEEARMNMPSSGENNWYWRLLPGQLTKETEVQLKNWTEIYNRK